MTKFTLERLKEVLESFEEAQSEVFFQNCIVALEKNNHHSGCKITVFGDKVTEFEVEWQVKLKTAGYKAGHKITEKAAEAISFLLSSELTEYKVIEEAVTFTGVDYWLGYSTDHADYDELNLFRARLEISGINKETPSNSLEKRTREKKKQTHQSDLTGLPAFVSIVEMHTPKALFERK